MKVNVINNSKYDLPEYATEGSAGMDLRANIENPLIIKGRQNTVIPTGISISLPVGYEAQVRGRSGLAFKNNVTAHLGTIDSDYRGEIRVKLFNNSDEDFIVKPGERIAQMVIAKYERVEWNQVTTLDETERGTGGFGHTGSK